MILTAEMFKQGKISNNGYNMKQLSFLGIVKLVKGWQHAIIGKDFPEEAINNFISHRNAKYLKNDLSRHSLTLKP